MSPLIQIETRWGKPIQSNGRKIIVQSRALQINLPFLNGGIVWNRPVSVLVLAEHGPDQFIPVRDVTRIAQVLLFIIAIGVAGIVRMGMSRRRG
ncbi:MAG: hypothetical protein HZB51_12430 [Chloroflexi bacterium]|nr:hypothetical protein [Chloroflexota bacterium]